MRLTVSVVARATPQADAAREHDRSGCLLSAWRDRQHRFQVVANIMLKAGCYRPEDISFAKARRDIIKQGLYIEWLSEKTKRADRGGFPVQMLAG
jgi:hypothetical protein